MPLRQEEEEEEKEEEKEEKEEEKEEEEEEWKEGRTKEGRVGKEAGRECLGNVERVGGRKER